jgi:hypothetical protein
MLKASPVAAREHKLIELDSDLVIVGGGLAGTCAAITAARQGIKVVLIQDRPVLGGNASSEVRLWTLGATSHMTNNNRWAREGGVINEILVENMWRNPEGNALVFDTVLLEKVISEENVTLLLNTAVFECEKSDPDTISGVRAFCSQNGTMYHVQAPLFCDSSGDGVLGFLAGAAFRMGAESSEEFGEKFAPSQEYGELLGHSMYFYSKDVGTPVKFVPPSYALDDVTKIPRFRSFNTRNYGCRLWWLEYGGRLDTVHETETIKWELWKVVYGVWNHIKNSGEFPDAETLTLEWVGVIPGKRESRRFEGDYMLTQRDIIEMRHFDDAVAFGGWSIDLHPADGVFSEKPGCSQWHSRGIYGIPYRCLYSRNIHNLFIAGRLISASHVAFGSSRVMATCAHGAQAIGAAAALCRMRNLKPAQLLRAGLPDLQRALLQTGQHLPGKRLEDSEDLAKQATISASSEWDLHELPPDGSTIPLDRGRGQMLPVEAGPMPQVTLTLDVQETTTLDVSLRVAHRPDNHTFNHVLESHSLNLQPGVGQKVTLPFTASIDEARYAFIRLEKNPVISIQCSSQRATGILALQYNRTQQPTNDIGIETFEVWHPVRRPAGENLAMGIEPPLVPGPAVQVANGVQRPSNRTNAWLAAVEDPNPILTLQWNEPQNIRHIDLFFDTDYDHPMESVLWGHPERAMPFCIKSYRVLAASGTLLFERDDNHETHNHIELGEGVSTDTLAIELRESWGNVPPALFEVRCYA